MEAEKAAMKASGQVVKTQGKIILATVKGDVHDIGKNIVGVVLACNNYDVIDMGVMVSCEKILERAKLEKADLIGLSGLITPSLDEMAHVAREMERQGFKLPPAHRRRTHEPRAHRGEDRAVLQRARRARPRREPRRAGDHHAPRERREEGGVRRPASRRLRAAPAHARRAERTLMPIEAARANATPIAWRSEDIATPTVTGVQVEGDFPLATLREYIDWTPFFHTWELKGVYPAILEHEKYGEQAAHHLRRGERAARRDHREEAPARTRRLRPLPGQRGGRRRRALHRRLAVEGARAFLLPPPADGEERRRKSQP